jgi:hypothetical protein
MCFSSDSPLLVLTEAIPEVQIHSPYTDPHFHPTRPPPARSSTHLHSSPFFSCTIYTSSTLDLLLSLTSPRMFRLTCLSGHFRPPTPLHPYPSLVPTSNRPKAGSIQVSWMGFASHSISFTLVEAILEVHLTSKDPPNSTKITPK